MAKMMEEMLEQEEDTQKGKFLTFALGKEFYGIEIKYVTEIIGIQPITEIPEVPEYVKGIINLRGKIIPVVDVRLKFRKEAIAYNDRTCIIVIEIKNLSVGLIVDNVAEVLAIPEEGIVPPPDTKTGFHNRYIKGIGKIGNDVKLLLDCEKLLTEDEVENLKQLIRRKNDLLLASLKVGDMMLQMEEKEFCRLTDYIHSHYGINLKQKKILIEGRLNAIIVEKGFNCFHDYLEKVFADQTGSEMTVLLNKLTTNHTFFMRESSHFEFLRDRILPPLVSQCKDRDLRIWSAGCSTGEEPYTLAMIIADFLGRESKLWDSKILATDISMRALESAEKGLYKSENLTDVPAAWKMNYFEKQSDQSYKVADKIKQNVIFRSFNLMEPIFPFKRKFHVIFCRNVMIYFDRKTKIDLVQKFYNSMETGGYLFIGHSESIARDETDFQYLLPAVYRKG